MVTDGQSVVSAVAQSVGEDGVAGGGGGAPSAQAQRRRQQLLAVARSRFVAEGYAGTTVASIVQAAGVAQGTFYLYFESKQAVLAELRRGVFARYEQALQTIQESALPAEERLVQAVAAMVAILQEELPLERVFREAESAEAMQRAVLRGRARLARSAQHLLEGEGVRPSVPDPEMAARITITIFDNLLYEALAYEGGPQVMRVATEGLRFVLHALGTPPPRIAALCAALSATLSASSSSMGGSEWGR